jgi:hypothetical protein
MEQPPCDIKEEPERRSRASRGQVSEKNLQTQKRVKYEPPVPPDSPRSDESPQSEKKASQLVLLKKKQQLGMKKDFSPVLMKQGKKILAAGVKSKDTTVKIRPY